MSFGSHEMIVRVAFRGAFDPDILHIWITDQADRIGVNGWSKEWQQLGFVEALFAGSASNVMEIIRIVSEGRQAQGIGDLSERPVSGDEPVWLGFHHLPPV